MRRRDRFSISSFQLADLGGKANYCYRDQLQTWGGGHPLSGCGLRDARLIAALLCQHGPSDPRQLVGEGSGQNVRMQALSGANEPTEIGAPPCPSRAIGKKVGAQFRQKFLKRSGASWV